MRKIAIVSAVAALAVATPALAANSGAYVGVGVTHDNFGGSADWENSENDVDGIGGTVFAGYDFKLSENVFAGVEANFDLASAKAGTKTNSFELDNAFGASARAGYNLNSSTALYGRVGYQRARTTTTSTSGTATTKKSTSYDGLRLGAGLETALTEQLSLRFEYNRTHYYLTAAEKKLLAAGKKGGYNNNQFSIGVAYGF